MTDFHIYSEFKIITKTSFCKSTNNLCMRIHKLLVGVAKPVYRQYPLWAITNIKNHARCTALIQTESLVIFNASRQAELCHMTSTQSVYKLVIFNYNLLFSNGSSLFIIFTFHCLHPLFVIFLMIINNFLQFLQREN